MELEWMARGRCTNVPPEVFFPSDGVGVEIPELAAPLEIGKGRVVREGTAVALLSFGTRLSTLYAASMSPGLNTSQIAAVMRMPSLTYSILSLFTKTSLKTPARSNWLCGRSTSHVRERRTPSGRFASALAHPSPEGLPAPQTPTRARSPRQALDRRGGRDRSHRSAPRCSPT